MVVYWELPILCQYLIPGNQIHVAMAMHIKTNQDNSHNELVEVKVFQNPDLVTGERPTLVLRLRSS